MAPRTCHAHKVNAHAPDFLCDLALGHSDAHRDPRTGLLWKHPARPYGLKREPAKPSPRNKTKHGVSWSDRPARR